MPCPTCGAEMDFVRADELDQSGQTFLPARRLACRRCAVNVVVPTGEPYRVRK